MLELFVVILLLIAIRFSKATHFQRGVLYTVIIFIYLLTPLLYDMVLMNPWEAVGKNFILVGLIFLVEFLIEDKKQEEKEDVL